MPEERSSQISNCAFPPWLLNNSHTSFTLIKIGFSLPSPPLPPPPNLPFFSLYLHFNLYYFPLSSSVSSATSSPPLAFPLPSFDRLSDT